MIRHEVSNVVRIEWVTHHRYDETQKNPAFVARKLRFTDILGETFEINCVAATAADLEVIDPLKEAQVEAVAMMTGDGLPPAGSKHEVLV